jgi:two-component system CheB/CheR fusion protein
VSTEPSVAADESLIIVGIGASAGGVEALSHLFRSIPPDVHAAFLVVTHLGPHRESQLSEILQRVTDLAVEDAIDGVQMQPRTVYVLPANSILTVEPERLSLRTVTVDQRERNPIDICFASLARVYGDNSIGIILSGVGHDGTLGIKAIKEEGGLTIVQAHDLDGPQHGGMAASAVGSGYVDLQLAVHDIGVKVDEYIRSSGALGILAAESDRRQVQEDRTLALKEIYEALRRRVGHDFEGYKEKTFLRRIQRRMQVVQQPSITAYTDYLRQNGEEASYLFRDLLIGVTSFFRDTEAFAALATHVIPRLFEHTTKQDTVRVWVPGCSTGEEAYSLSILMREHMVKLDEMPKVQIFATDIDDAALSAARAGRYPAALLDGMSPQRLQRFFRKEPGSYIVNKELRDLCVFSSHSVIRDPPFSRMDFVSCRNLLIYFNADLQNSVLPVIHYALKPHGFLFLGPSENVSRHSDLFAVVDKKHRIFQRRAAVNANARIPVWAARIKGPGKGYAGHDLMHKDQRMRQVIEDRVLEGFAPAHIVIDGEGDILFYSARTGKYLEPQMGTPSRQLLSMARRGLRLELRSTLREAVEKRQTIVRERLEVDVDDRIQAIRLTIEPLPDSTPEPLFLVVFTDLGPPISREEAASLRPYSVGDDDVSHLEDELKETRDRLQATIEEYETALEELKSGNEELVSVNEELQSTNEEMETSKEELQSVNEELHTVNTELNDRVEELHRANADMHNLLESTQIATVFLDRNMVIRSYTPSVTSIFSLIATDRGRPITDVAHNLQDIDLRQYVRRVLDERASLERTVQQRDSNVYYLMRVLPYRTADDHIDGALVTFVNVTAVVAAEEQQRLLVAELNHRVRNMLQVVMGLANQSLHRSDDLQQFTKVFFGRMQALSRAYELLSRDGWHKVPVGELLRSQLMPFATEGNRYSTEGENLVLRANAALALGMVIYELSTNATKYGALSVSAGRVRITWALEKSSDEQLNFVLRWQESGGPEVKEPTRHGFGSELVHRQLKYELNGTATMNFAEEGLEATLVMPADEAIDLSERRLSG